MKRLFFITSLTLMPMFVSSPAHAVDPVTLVCTELSAPTNALVAGSADPLYREPPLRDGASLANLKAHPMKRTVAYGVSCQIGGDLFAPESWRQACHIVSESYGRWVPNTRNSTRALIWRPVRCKDSLFYRVQ